MNKQKNSTIAATPVTHAQDVDALCTQDTQSLVTASDAVTDLQTDVRVDETMLSPPPPSVGSNNDMMISPRFQIPPDISMLSPPPVSPKYFVTPQSQSLTSVTQQQEPAQVPSLPSLEVPSISQYPKQADLQTNITIRNGLIHHSYLDTLNLCVNEEFHFLVCMTCEVALTKKETLKHLTNKHSILLVDHVQFTTAMMKTNVAEDLPVIIEGPRDMVAGLSTHDALGCDHCHQVYTVAKKMQRHHSNIHSNIPKPRIWRECKAQCMHSMGSGIHRVLWEVKTSGHIAEHQSSKELLVEALLMEAREELKVSQTASATSDERMVTPWLRTTRWHEYVSSSTWDVETLRRMVAVPKDNDDIIPGLRSAVQTYFQEALDLLDSTDELVLQRLNSPDPLKSGISNTPLHRHMLAKTMNDYVVPVVAKLA
ncbi:hypothetical protein BU15DRAFT_84071 [Melanogaster broomeanus]|nr:hypothetical protein BU15DRAFT_84071 [Melanogaster broomeanus]